MKRIILGGMLLLAALAVSAQTAERLKLAPDTPKFRIMFMDPAKVDPSALPLDRVDQLHPTGTPQKIADLSAWRLAVRGKALARELSLSYAELSAMPMVRKPVLLICPEFFVDYVEWEGVPVRALLEKAGVRPDYATVSVKAYDGYTQRFPRATLETHLLFLALRVNGQTLPTQDGFPARLVAEDLFGGQWVKWVSEIRAD